MIKSRNKMDFEKGDFMDLFLVCQKMYFVFNVQNKFGSFLKQWK